MIPSIRKFKEEVARLRDKNRVKREKKKSFVTTTFEEKAALKNFNLFETFSLRSLSLSLSFVTTNPFLSVSLSVSFAGWRETQTKEDDKMSDERMMTMDEDEEIGQVRFVDVLCIYVFSVFLSLLIAEMAEMMIIIIVVVIIIAGGFYRALLCELPNHSNLLLSMCARRERERRLLSLSRRKRGRRSIL